MIRNICDFMLDTLIEGKIIKDNERQVYYYCIEGMIEIFGNILVTLIIGIVVGKMSETLLFLCVFILLRSLSGGYHVQNENFCFIFSIVIFLIVILAVDYLKNEFEIAWSIHAYLLSLFCILMMAPVDCRNKRLRIEKKQKLKKMVLNVMIAISSVYVILLKMQSYDYVFIITNTTLMTSLLLIMGNIKNIRDNYLGL